MQSAVSSRLPIFLPTDKVPILRQVEVPYIAVPKEKVAKIDELFRSCIAPKLPLLISNLQFKQPTPAHAVAIRARQFQDKEQVMLNLFSQRLQELLYSMQLKDFPPQDVIVFAKQAIIDDIVKITAHVGSISEDFIRNQKIIEPCRHLLGDLKKPIELLKRAEDATRAAFKSVLVTKDPVKYRYLVEKNPAHAESMVKIFAQVSSTLPRDQNSLIAGILNGLDSTW